MTIAVEKLTPVIGAKVTGVDLSHPLTDAQFEQIHDAWVAHKVLAFPRQDISHQAYEAFAAKFGSLYKTSIRNHDGETAVRELRTEEDATTAFGETWHADMTSEPEPPMGTMLRVVTLPKDHGGDTMFADMYAAYEMLSDRMKVFLDGLTADHDSSIFVKKYGIEKQLPKATHPVVRTHPESKRKALFVNTRFTARINELSEGESRAVLDYLFRHVAETPYFQLRFRWERDTLLLWDNRCTQHCAIFDYKSELRVGYRIMIKGDRPT